MTSQRETFRTSTIWALVAGFLLGIGGTVTMWATASMTVFIVAGVASLAGAILFAIGSVEVARAKGYGGGWAAVGLLGLFGLLGLIAILLLPDRRFPVVTPPRMAAVAGTGPLSLDRCPACGRLVPRGEPCPECAARQSRPRSNAWDLRVIAAVVVGAIAIGIGAAVIVPLSIATADDWRWSHAQAQDAAAKSLVMNAMTAIESAYVDYRTFAFPEEVPGTIEPSILFRRAPDHLVTVSGDLVTHVRPEAADSAVEYFGDDKTYSVVTTSETGTLWGAYVDKTGSGNWYLRSDGGDTSVGW